METVKIPDSYDSKFRFILVVAERAKQLLNGAPPRVQTKGRKPVCQLSFEPGAVRLS